MRRTAAALAGAQSTATAADGAARLSVASVTVPSPPSAATMRRSAAAVAEERSAAPARSGHVSRAGSVAGKAGVTPDTIRYYERLGLLPKPTRTAAGYREYGEGIVNRLMLIRNAQQFGFSLRDIASFLRVRTR